MRATSRAFSRKLVFARQRAVGRGSGVSVEMDFAMLFTLRAGVIAGSLISGLIVRLAFHRVGGSFLIALVVSTGIVWLIRRSRGGRVGSPPARYTRYR